MMHGTTTAIINNIKPAFAIYTILTAHAYVVTLMLLVPLFCNTERRNVVDAVIVWTAIVWRFVNASYVGALIIFEPSIAVEPFIQRTARLLFPLFVGKLANPINNHVPAGSVTDEFVLFQLVDELTEVETG